VISTPATTHISAQTPAILPAGFQVNIHDIGINYFAKFQPLFRRMMCRNSVVGTDTCYGLEGTGFEPRWVRDFPRTFTLVLGPTQRVTGFFFGVQRPGRGVDHPLTSDAEVKRESRAVPLLPLCAFIACSRVNILLFPVNDRLQYCSRYS
jgi:hypothetical protein